jgi:hypothetical protein
MTGHWIAYIDMTPAQKSEASRRAGHHELIDREQRKIIEAALKAWDRTPEMSRKWKSATFSLAPERP